MLVGSIVTGIISFFLNSYYTGKNLGYSSWQQLKDVAPSYLIAFVIAVSVYFFKFLPLNYYAILAIQLAVGTVVFFVVCEVWNSVEYQEVKNIAKNYLEKIIKS